MTSSRAPRPAVFRRRSPASSRLTPATSNVLRKVRVCLKPLTPLSRLPRIPENSNEKENEDDFVSKCVDRDHGRRAVFECPTGSRGTREEQSAAESRLRL